MTLAQVITLIRDGCIKAGGQNAWAQTVGVSGSYVSDVLAMRREPSRKILEPLGIEKIVTYRRKAGQ